jgi:hypothetical protein
MTINGIYSLQNYLETIHQQIWAKWNEQEKTKRQQKLGLKKKGGLQRRFWPSP